MKRHCVPLTEPQPKRFASLKPGQPLPVPITTLSGVLASNNYWAVYRGRLVHHDGLGPQGRGVTVVVEQEGAVQALTEHGYFGVVVAGDDSGGWLDQARVMVRDWKPGEDMEVKTEEENVKQEKSEPDGNFDDDLASSVGPSNWGDIKRLPDLLHLELCEAFFLSYSLGCLTVRETVSGELSIKSMWDMFCGLELDFPLRYRAYHQYRALGWVVRSGYHMGCDWALYKLGPPFYHASYTVRVEGVDRSTGRALDSQVVGVRSVTWGDLLAQTRVAVTVKKETLLARVEVWKDKRDWDTPHCLASMAVVSLRVRRWREGDSRWQVKPAVPVDLKTKSWPNTKCEKKVAECDIIGEKQDKAVIVLD